MKNDITGGGYYLVIPAYVAEDTRLRERSKLIYGRIVQMAAKTGFCYASNEVLLDILSFQNPETGEVNKISERTLQSCLAELRDRGHIHMDTGPAPLEDGSGYVSRRRIFIGQKLAEMPPADMGEENCTPADFCTQGVKKSSPPYNSKNNTRRTIPPISPVEVYDAIEAYIGDDPEYRTAFEGFLRNRAALKKPVKTAQAMNTIINRLRKVNQRETEIAMLNKAIEHNWLTVYELKPDELPAPPSQPQNWEERFGWR